MKSQNVITRSISKPGHVCIWLKLICSGLFWKLDKLPVHCFWDFFLSNELNKLKTLKTKPNWNEKYATWFYLIHSKIPTFQILVTKILASSCDLIGLFTSIFQPSPVRSLFQKKKSHDLARSFLLTFNWLNVCACITLSVVSWH